MTLAQTPVVAEQAVTHPYEVGNALSLVPQGVTHDVEIVIQEPPNSSFNTVFIAIRNNSQHAVGVTDVLGTARDRFGLLVSTAAGSSITPYRLDPNGIALGLVGFEVGIVLDDATIELEVEYEPWTEDSVVMDLQIVEAVIQKPGLIGIAKNISEVSLSGPFGVRAFGFDPQGHIVSFFGGETAKAALESEETTTFSVDFHGDSHYDTYLVSSLH